jgi:hypothetical protein
VTSRQRIVGSSISPSWALVEPGEIFGALESPPPGPAVERPPYLVAEDGSLWRREPGIPRAGRGTRDFRYAITVPEGGPPGIAWFERSLNPETVAELDAKEARRREAAERQAAELRKEREALRKNPPRRTLTLGDTDRALGKATLRELAYRLEAAGGVLMVERDGGLDLPGAGRHR